MTGEPVARPGDGAEAPPAGPTGHRGVDALLARAADLESLPVSEHPGRYEELHAALVAELDAEPGTAPDGAAPPSRPGRR